MVEHKEKADLGSQVFCGVITGGVLGYFYYRYAFHNPDLEGNGNQECFSQGNDVTARFIIFFTYSFWLMVAYAGNSVLSLLGHILGFKWLRSLCNGINGIIQICSLAVLIIGAVWRFSETGMYCSGKYLEVPGEFYMTKSGHFMGIVIGVQLALMMLSCVIMCCVMMFGKKHHDEHHD